MADLNVSIPETMKDWVEAQAKSGRYDNAGDYLRDLIRRDQDRAATLGRLQDEIDEGFASGSSDRSMSDVLGEARRRAGVGKGSM